MTTTIFQGSNHVRLEQVERNAPVVVVDKGFLDVLDAVTGAINAANFGPADAHLLALTLSTIFIDQCPIPDGDLAFIRKLALKIAGETEAT